jgi:hypothetical protein
MRNQRERERKRKRKGEIERVVVYKENERVDGSGRKKER